MQLKLSKTEARRRIEMFFERGEFSPDEMKKIKRLAMKNKIKLGTYRKLFCKKCLSRLRGKTRVSITHKTIICEKCNCKNRFRLS